VRGNEGTREGRERKLHWGGAEVKLLLNYLATARELSKPIPL
jgi:hypothetical protein